jgi:hypothetical protein
MRPIFDGNFNFENHIELEYVLDNLNPKIAINILELGIEQGLREGIYDLTEVHCLYKSLRFLKNYEDKNNNLFNDNNDGDNN